MEAALFDIYRLPTEKILQNNLGAVFGNGSVNDCLTRLAMQYQAKLFAYNEASDAGIPSHLFVEDYRGVNAWSFGVFSVGKA